MKKYMRDIVGPGVEPRPKNREDVAMRYRITTNGIRYRVEHLLAVSILRWAAENKEEWVPVSDGFSSLMFAENQMAREIDIEWDHYTEWKPIEDKCICTHICDCQSPDSNPAMVSNECPIHNDDPDPSPECPVHKEGKI